MLTDEAMAELQYDLDNAQERMYKLIKKELKKISGDDFSPYHGHNDNCVDFRCKFYQDMNGYENRDQHVVDDEDTMDCKY